MQASQDATLLANFVSVEEVLKAADVHSYDDMLPVIAGIARSEWRKRLIGYIIRQRGRRMAANLMDIGVVSHVYLDVDGAQVN